MQFSAVLELVRARWGPTGDAPRGLGDLDDIATAVIAFDRRRVIVAANLAAEWYTLHPRGELIGRSVDTIVPARFRQPDAPPPVATTEATTVELSALRADGSEVMTVWTFAALDEVAPLFVMTLRERTHVLADIEASAYAAVFEKAPVPIALSRLTDNTLVMMNEAFADLFEVRREEFIGRTSAGLGIATVEQRQEVARLLAETGAVRELECERRTVSGKTIHILLSVTPLKIGDVDHLMSTVQDISARKAQEAAVAQAQAAAELERQKLRSILMQAPVAICMLEGPDHRFTFANPRYVALVGNRDVVGKPALEVLPELREGGFDKLLDGVRATGEPFVGRDAVVKLPHLTPGEKLVVDFVYAPIRNESGAIDAIVAVIADVTERAKANADLVESRARADYAVRLSGIGFWYCDLPFDELAWDAQVKEHFFLPPDARVTIETFYDRIVPEDRERTRAAIDASIQQRMLYDVNYRTHDAHGRLKWIRAMGGAAYAADGTPIRFDGVTVDITKQKHDEERIASAATELVEANRVKDDFLAMLGHELRNPLAPITTAVQLLKMRHQKGRELEVIERQAEHLTHLVDDLLDISRITRGKVELETHPCPIGEIVRAAVEMVAPLIANAEHVLIQDVPDGLIVDVDRRRMVQVISNLLSNAARYTPARGRITVTAFRDGAEVGVSVADTGEGIAADLLPLVFDMFVQARQGLARSQGGLGLGLAIVKGLVAAHGGRVSVHSDGPGRGSVFEVRLPAASASVAPALHRPSPSVTTVATVRVLVVDDNVDSGILLSEALTTLGCQTAVAHDGLQALEVAAEFSPDVVLLDIGLPLLDGFEVARRLRASRPDLDVIAVTGYGQAADVERSRAAGFRAHLTKPVDFTELSALLREFGSRK